MRLVLIISVLSQLSNAAPFCVVTGAGRQCFYHSADACFEAAKRYDGMCIPNEAEQSGAPSAGSESISTSAQKIAGGLAAYGEAVRQEREAEDRDFDRRLQHNYRMETDTAYRLAYAKTMEEVNKEKAAKAAENKRASENANLLTVIVVSLTAVGIFAALAVGAE